MSEFKNGWRDGFPPIADLVLYNSRTVLLRCTSSGRPRVLSGYLNWWPDGDPQWILSGPECHVLKGVTHWQPVPSTEIE